MCWFPCLQLREFASGVKVLQSSSHSEANVCKRIAELVRVKPGGVGCRVRARVGLKGEGDGGALRCSKGSKAQQRG
jgi:hypothetical protein